MIHHFNGDKSETYVMTQQGGAHASMLMDIEAHFFKANDVKKFTSPSDEVALLLIKGEVEFLVDGKTYTAKRECCFAQKPYCLHVPSGTQVEVRANADSEVLVQKTKNAAKFGIVFYTPDQIQDVVLCGDIMEQTARRILRDIFNYKNAPYSNMVLGEVITPAGRWSSYPPHHHRQPEVYYHKFDKPQGFGISIIGEEAFVAKDRSFSVIEGGLCHPQATAPGYSMYYAWMIRHLDNDPWTERIDDPAHSWLYESRS